MSAFLQSGRSDQQNFNEMTGRFRPQADVRGDYCIALGVSCQCHADAFRLAGFDGASFVARSLPHSTNEVLGEVCAGNQNRPEHDNEEAKATNCGSRVYTFGSGQVVNQ